VELSRNLLDNLLQLGINPISLSENEKNFLTQINTIFEEFVDLNTKLSNEISENKFNKTQVLNQVGFVRRTLYRNPTLIMYIEWCEKQAIKITNNKNTSQLISREKYDRLKEENSNLLLNIVDDALRDDEIDRLAKENDELKKRIENLTSRFEEKEVELKQLRKKIRT
jgi:hypothetical protein